MAVLIACKTSIDKDSNAFKYALLEAALHTNDVVLGKKLLERGLGRWDSNRPRRKNYLAIAAFQGNLELMGLLAQDLPPTGLLGNWNHPRQSILRKAYQAAANGASVDALRLLDRTHPRNNAFLLEWALGHTTCDEIYEHCGGLAGNVNPKSLSERFSRASKQNATPLMERLVQLGATVNRDTDERYVWAANESEAYNSPISQAAIRGHYEAVKFLLDHGAIMERSLEAAAAYGSPRVVLLLLEHNRHSQHDPHNDTILRNALSKAIMKEDEELCRLLIKHGATVDKRTNRLLARRAKEEGLDSMVGFLKQYE
ncbi:Uu.00g051520.m01.CDS01 [Anthostomella pinea]|uniref:Uu.00g051520.m01.CDS01 n=1 Tax=Anthostomella pinea TaxID=933095 RepID=A0AAI8VTH5_9PEZI|nr:Uu.00g051520.m01.CDS01 [Anthostomella pinea]